MKKINLKKHLLTVVFIISFFTPSFIYAEGAFLADKVSPETIGYMRIPNPWSFLGDPSIPFRKMRKMSIYLKNGKGWDW